MTGGDAIQIAAAVIISLGGGGAIVLGLSSWIGKLWADRLLARESAAHQRSLEAHKRELELAFNARNRVSEAEFEIYRSLWAEVTKLAYMGQGIRSGLTRSTLTEEQHIARYRQFQHLLREFEVLYQSQRPFCAPEVHEAIRHLAQCVSLENKRAIADRDLDGMELGESHMEGVIPILEATEAVCAAIRARLYPPAASPGTLVTQQAAH